MITPPALLFLDEPTTGTWRKPARSPRRTITRDRADLGRLLAKLVDDVAARLADL